MKKLSLLLFSLFLVVPQALAATVTTEAPTYLAKHQTKELFPVVVTSTSDGDIRAEYGINLVLEPDPEFWVLWDERTPSVTGTAINNGHVNLNVKMEYSADKKRIHIPVMENWAAGDYLIINGLALRAYSRSISARPIGMDLTGDLIPDIYDINFFDIDEDTVSDKTPPYQVQNASYTLNANGSITLSWVHPPDFDIDSVAIDRNIRKNGNDNLVNIFNGFQLTYTDSSAELADATSVTYYIMARDSGGNLGIPVEFTISLGNGTPEEVIPPDNTDEEAVPETEADQLGRLLNYYKVRYSIKCMPGGVARPANDANCLWSRIDLVYAQEKLGRTDVDISLTDWDISLMAKRLEFTEARYQTNCTDASEPASYCAALAKAINRVHYFVDRQ